MSKRKNINHKSPESSISHIKKIDDDEEDNEIQNSRLLNTLYSKSKLKFMNYINKNKQNLKFILNNSTFSKISADEYLDKSTKINNQTTSDEKLTLLPYISFRRINNDYEKKQLKTMERNTVFMRRLEYIYKNKFKQLQKKYQNDMDKINYLQSYIKGYLIRKNVRQIFYMKYRFELSIFHIQLYGITKRNYNNLYYPQKDKRQETKNISNNNNKNLKKNRFLSPKTLKEKDKLNMNLNKKNEKNSNSQNKTIGCPKECNINNNDSNNNNKYKFTRKKEKNSSSQSKDKNFHTFNNQNVNYENLSSKNKDNNLQTFKKINLNEDNVSSKKNNKTKNNKHTENSISTNKNLKKDELDNKNNENINYIMKKKQNSKDENIDYTNENITKLINNNISQSSLSKSEELLSNKKSSIIQSKNSDTKNNNKSNIKNNTNQQNEKNIFLFKNKIYHENENQENKDSKSNNNSLSDKQMKSKNNKSFKEKEYPLNFNFVNYQKMSKELKSKYVDNFLEENQINLHNCKNISKSLIVLLLLLKIRININCKIYLFKQLLLCKNLKKDLEKEGENDDDEDPLNKTKEDDFNLTNEREKKLCGIFFPLTNKLKKNIIQNNEIKIDNFESLNENINILNNNKDNYLPNNKNKNKII